MTETAAAAGAPLTDAPFTEAPVASDTLPTDTAALRAVDPSVRRIEDFYAIVPAGGAGTRLWPVSRQSAPKFLHDLTGSGRTLLQATCDRLSPITGGKIMLVTGVKHVDACRAQLPNLAASDVLAEPLPRDSMAAIGLAAAVLQQRHGDVIVGSFAADHVISGQVAFEQVVREAVAAARAGYVTTIGIAASRPSTAFGYVRSSDSLGIAEAPSALHVTGFTEKPDAATAMEYLVTGEYRWNAGMFVVRTDVLLGHLAAGHPELAAGLTTIAKAWDTPQRDEVMNATWPGLEKIAIDHAVAEPVAAQGGVAVVPSTFGWDDIGDFNSLAALLPAVGDSGNKIAGDQSHVLRIETGGNVIVPGANSERVIALLGVNDLVVVDTDDALLVTTRSRAQQVKNVVDALHERGIEDVL